MLAILFYVTLYDERLCELWTLQSGQFANWTFHVLDSSPVPRSHFTYAIDLLNCDMFYHPLKWIPFNFVVKLNIQIAEV